MRTYVENGNGKLKQVRNRFGGFEKPQHRVACLVRRNVILDRDLRRQFQTEVADDLDDVVVDTRERSASTGLPVEANGVVKHRSGNVTVHVKYDAEGRVLRAFAG